MEPDVTLREFIDKIKREGIEEGKKLSESIHAEARAEADSIVREAEEKAARLL